MKKILFAFFLPASLLFFSCSKEDTPSVEDLKFQLQSVHLDVADVLGNLQEGEGMQTVLAFQECMQESMQVKGSPNTVILPSFLPDLFFPGGLDAVAGTYTWDSAEKQWIYTPAYPADEVHYIFPSGGPSVSVNDSRFVVEQFELASVPMGDAVYDRPQEVSAHIMKDESLVFTLEMLASYEGDTIPSSLVMNTFLHPMNLGYQFSLSEENQMEVLLTMDEAQRELLKLDADLSYTAKRDSITGFKGQLLLVDVLIEGGIDLNELANISMPSQLNDFQDMVVYTYPDRVKIADFLLAVNQNLTFDLMLQFTDGSIEPADTYFTPVLTVFETFFADFAIFGLN